MFDIKIYLFEKLDIINPFSRRQRYNKDNVRLLFIDDKDMPVVENLKRSGFRVTKRSDIRNIDDPEVQSAQIIFVDYDGVGRTISSQHQGAGLVKDLKDRYGQKKFIVLYTAQKNLPVDTIFSSYLNKADDKIKKDADETKFTEVINKALKTLR